jgi:hypothetical protein
MGQTAGFAAGHGLSDSFLDSAAALLSLFVDQLSGCQHRSLKNEN